MQSGNGNRRLGAIGLVAMGLLALAAFRTDAIAQAARAVLMKSADEPGRSPYMSTSVTPVRCEGFGFVCRFEFAPVPAGKRLVVTHFGGTIEPSLVANTNRLAQLSTVANETDHYPMISTGYIPGLQKEIWNQPVVFFIEGGQTPVVKVFPPSIDNRFRLTGYLVDVTF